MAHELAVWLFADRVGTLALVDLRQWLRVDPVMAPLLTILASPSAMAIPVHRVARISDALKGFRCNFSILIPPRSL